VPAFAERLPHPVRGQHQHAADLTSEQTLKTGSAAADRDRAPATAVRCKDAEAAALGDPC
jgi:hypothetical protein